MIVKKTKYGKRGYITAERQDNWMHYDFQSNRFNLGTTEYRDDECVANLHVLVDGHGDIVQVALCLTNEKAKDDVHPYIVTYELRKPIKYSVTDGSIKFKFQR